MKTFAILASSDLSTGPYVVEALLAADLSPVAVVLDSLPTKPRDVELHQHRTGDALPIRPMTSVTANGGQFITFDNHNGADCVDYLKSLKVDFVVNAGTPRILKTPILQATPAILNCHPGLLPWFRGSGAVEWALYFNEPISNTIHLMSEGIDEGAILATEAIHINNQDSYQDVRRRVFEQGFALFAQTVRDLAEGKRVLSDAVKQGEGRYFHPPTTQQVQKAIERLQLDQYDGSVPPGTSALKSD